LKPRVFIGSSVESLGIANAIQANLEHDAESTVWNQGNFPLSSDTVDALIGAADNSDFGVFVFSSDDVTRLREVEYKVARDNVVFELGLFIGKLGRLRTIIIKPRGINDFHLPTDLLGVTPGTFEPNRSDGNMIAALGPCCGQIRQSLEKLGRIHTVNESKDTQTEKPSEYSVTDYLGILEHWLSVCSFDTARFLVRYAELDKELGFPNGTTKSWIQHVTGKFFLKAIQQGEQTILFEVDEVAKLKAYETTPSQFANKEW